LGGSDTGLRPRAAQIHLDESRNRELARSRLGVERMAELAQGVDGGRLSALEMADEMPPELRAVTVVLRLELLCAVLAHDLDSGLGEERELIDGDVLRRDDDRDTRADLLLDARVAVAHFLKRRMQ